MCSHGYEIRIVIPVIIGLICLLIGGVSADSYVLEVFGNANLDSTIDNADITYVQGVIDGKEAKSEYSDANHDGKVDENDLAFIREIIDGTAKSITIRDFDKKDKTVQLPVSRIIPTYNYEAWAVQALGAKEKVVAIDQSVKEKEGLLLEDFVNLPSVGTWENYDLEEIIGLKPGVVIVFERDWLSDGNSGMDSSIESAVPGSSVIAIMPRNMGEFMPEMAKLAYALGERETWNDLSGFISSIEKQISDKVSSLKQEKKLRVLVIDQSHSESYGDIRTLGSQAKGQNMVVEAAGGINIARELPGDLVAVDPEWIIEQNPDAIVISRSTDMGYGTDDPAGSEEFLKTFKENSWVQQTKAGKDDRIYMISWPSMQSEWFIGLPYLAKMFYPDLFEELDPQEIQQKFLKDYMGMSYNLKDHGVFVYPGIQNGNSIVGIPS